VDHSVECACCKSTIVLDKNYPGAPTAGWKTQQLGFCHCVVDDKQEISKGSVLCDYCFGCFKEKK
jgi:hypothetical protein